jgi:hypothetical protein
MSQGRCATIILLDEWFYAAPERSRFNQPVADART